MHWNNKCARGIFLTGITLLASLVSGCTIHVFEKIDHSDRIAKLHQIPKKISTSVHVDKLGAMKVELTPHARVQIQIKLPTQLEAPAAITAEVDTPRPWERAHPLPLLGEATAMWTKCTPETQAWLRGAQAQHGLPLRFIIEDGESIHFMHRGIMRSHPLEWASKRWPDDAPAKHATRMRLLYLVSVPVDLALSPAYTVMGVTVFAVFGLAIWAGP